jgi:hypothetical protein
MKKLIVFFHVLVFVSIFISLAGAGEYINNCPVPDNLKIIEPAGSVVPPKLALLSGIWEGSWASSALFIVEQIKEKEAVVVFAWAGSTARTQAGTSFAPGFFRLKCPIEQGEDGNYQIIFTTKTATYRLIQTNDARQIRVLREGSGTSSPQYRDSIFMKKEMK